MTVVPIRSNRDLAFIAIRETVKGGQRVYPIVFVYRDGLSVVEYEAPSLNVACRRSHFIADGVCDIKLQLKPFD